MNIGYLTNFTQLAGRPLIDYETVVQLIGNVKTKKELSVICKLDENDYQRGMTVSDQVKSQLTILLVKKG